MNVLIGLKKNAREDIVLHKNLQVWRVMVLNAGKKFQETCKSFSFSLQRRKRTVTANDLIQKTRDKLMWIPRSFATKLDAKVGAI